MSEFLSRLGETGKTMLGFILVVIMSVIFAMVIIAVVLILPLYLLSMVLGEYAGWWFIIFIVGIVIFAEWGKLSKWIYWQFIEPFKK